MPQMLKKKREVLDFVCIFDGFLSVCATMASYPQVIHVKSKDVTGGGFTCQEFVDVNGKKYNDWIPAIRLG